MKQFLDDKTYRPGLGPFQRTKLRTRLTRAPSPRLGRGGSPRASGLVATLYDSLR